MKTHSFARASILAALSLAALFVWWQVLTTAPHLVVTFLDVGQGDCAVIQTPGGHVVVVDTGGWTPEDDHGRRTLVPFLRAQGIHCVDALVLTHPDDDHIGGATTLMERIPVRWLLVSGLPSDSATYGEVLATARRRGVRLATLRRGQFLQFSDGVLAEVLHPPAGGLPLLEHADNNGSIVLRIRWENTSFLLPGDAEAEAEAAMLVSGLDLRADVLKLGHHGSATSSTEAFLHAVQPQVAIVSAGRRNPFGHPHPDVLARLEARKIRIFRTDRDGGITMVSDGATVRITTTLKRSARPTPTPIP